MNMDQYIIYRINPDGIRRNVGTAFCESDAYRGVASLTACPSLAGSTYGYELNPKYATAA